MPRASGGEMRLCWGRQGCREAGEWLAATDLAMRTFEANFYDAEALADELGRYSMESKANATNVQ
jgi:hypothetical protein